MVLQRPLISPPFIFIIFASSGSPEELIEWISPRQFELIFPHIPKDEIDHLAYNPNLTEKHLWKATLKEWVDKNWVDPKDDSGVVENAYNVRRFEEYAGTGYSPLLGANKIYALAQAEQFMRQRQVVHIYIDYMYRGAQILGLLNRTEADWMRDVFWSTDDDCHNFWRCTEKTFFTTTELNLSRKFGRHSVNESLLALSQGVVNTLNYSDILHWTAK